MSNTFSNSNDPQTRLYDYVNYNDNRLAVALGGKKQRNRVKLLILLGQSNVEGSAVLADAVGLNSYVWKPEIVAAKDGFTVATNGTVKAYNAAEVSPIAQVPPVLQVLQTSPVMIYNKAVDTNINGVWEEYIGTNGLAENGYIGSELSIAYNWATNEFLKSGERLYIIKWAKGGTSLGSRSGDAALKNWTTDKTQLWYNFIEKCYKPAILELQMKGLIPECLGVYWGQGESDAIDGISDSYETNLRSLITDRFRRQLGFPDIKVFLMGLSKRENANVIPFRVVKAAQVNVAEGPNKLPDVYLLRTDGSDGSIRTNMRSDNLHYTALGVHEIGTQLYNQFVKYLPVPYTSCNNFEFVGEVSDIGNIVNTGILVDNKSGALLKVSPLLHKTGEYTKALSWFGDGSLTRRPAFNTGDVPYFEMTNIQGARDQEIITGVSMIGRDATTAHNCVVGFMLRTNLLSTYPTWTSGNPNPPITNGLMVQIRANDVGIVPYMINVFTFINNVYSKLGGDVLTPTLSPAVTIGDTVYYRIRYVDDVLTVECSQTITPRIWTPMLTFDVPSDRFVPSTGNSYCMNYLGQTSTLGQMRANFAIDMLVANKL
jgi:hypothetical protein